MICQKCGTNASATAKFCSTCGVSFAQTSQPAPQGAVNTVEPPPQQRSFALPIIGEMTLGKWSAVAGTVFAIGLLIAGSAGAFKIAPKVGITPAPVTAPTQDPDYGFTPVPVAPNRYSGPGYVPQENNSQPQIGSGVGCYEGDRVSNDGLCHDRYTGQGYAPSSG